MATAVNNNVKLKESITSASTVRPASRTASSGVRSPRAPARNAKAWPARPEAKRAGSSRRASPERAMRGPASAVPRTAASSAMASAAAPTSCGHGRGTGSRAERPCEATARAGPRQRLSAMQGGAGGSRDHLSLRRLPDENPALSERPEGEEESDEHDGSAVVVEEDRGRNPNRRGDRRHRGNPHQVKQHRGRTPDTTHLTPTLER